MTYKISVGNLMSEENVNTILEYMQHPISLSLVYSFTDVTIHIHQKADLPTTTTFS